MKPLISIIIPNWNGKQLLEHCLASLAKLTYPNFEVLVVDNGSRDDSIDFLHKNYPQFRTIPLSTNTGFSHAVNVGIRESKGAYIALLNNDTEVDHRWLDELILPFERDNQIGIVASKLLNFYNRDILDSAGDVLNIVGQAYPIGGGSTDGPEWNKGSFIFSGTGGASLYKREMFDRIGMFEETFFMYFEDMDLSYRAQRAGYTVWYQPTAIVYHIQKASSRKSRSFLEYLLYRNFVINYLINTPRELFFKRLSLFKFILVFIHTFYYQTKEGHLDAAVKTWLWLATHVGTIMRLRGVRQKTADPSITPEYIGSFLADKKLKAAGFIF